MNVIRLFDPITEINMKSCGSVTQGYQKPLRCNERNDTVNVKLQTLYEL